MDDRGYFLSRLEFTALLLIKGITVLYTFPLPEAEEISRERLVSAVYELIKAGFCDIQENAFCLTERAEELMEPLSCPGICVRLEPGKNLLPQKLVYFGKGITVLEDCVYEDDTIRIQGMQYEKFWKWMENVLPLEAAVPKTLDGARSLIEMNQEAQAEFEKLKKSRAKEPSEKLRSWSDRIKEESSCEVLGNALIAETDTGRARCDVLLLRGALNTWIVQQEEAGDLIAGADRGQRTLVTPDTEEFREQFLKNIKRWAG